MEQVRTYDAKQSDPQQSASGRSHHAPAGHERGQPLLRLQRSLGNRGFGQLVQRKVRVSQPGDAHELEADRVADSVMRLPADGAAPAEVSRKPAPVQVQRACAKCEDEEEKKQLEVSRKDAGGGASLSAQTPAAPASRGAESAKSSSGVLEGLGGGHPLPESERGFFEPRFGRDFGDVRIHTSARAAESAEALNARAYTFGADIVFGGGEYKPGTTAGRHLLAHELTHVVQNSGTTPADTVSRSVESDAARIESLLSYGLFDWAITDADAIEAVNILSNLPPDLQRDVLRRIDIGRLQENLPRPYQPILERILTNAGTPPANVQETITRIQDLLSYGVFDWAITDSDAREAFRLIRTLPPAEQQRVVRVINYQRLYDNLPDAADRTALEAIRGPAMAHEATEQATMEGFRTRARSIVTQIKANADAMTLPAPSPSGAFESFLASEYLGAYCAAPSGETAGPAIEQMSLEGAGGFSHYGFGLLRDMAARAGNRGIGHIDSPSLLGTPQPGAVTANTFFDPWSQGPNPTQIMHFAAGIKWSWAPAFLVQWYFIHYEEVTEEGWQIFGLDSLNDIIAEEGGRILAEDLKSGRACTGGLIDLDPYFARGRAFLRSHLSESRLTELALRVHLPHLVVATGAGGGGVLSRALYSMTVMEQLMAGASDAAVLGSPDARILTLLFNLLRKG